MITIVKTLQLFLAVLVTFLVLIQSKGAGLSSTFGGSGGFYRTRRGVEKTVFIITVVSAVLLVANSLAIVLLS